MNHLLGKMPKFSFGNQLLFLALALVALKLGSLQTPIAKAAGKQVNNIADERARFGYGYTRGKFKQYFALPITFELGWAERGFYYRELSEKLDTPISVVNTNIGYFGYAAGDLVNVMGGVLTDPYIARQPVENRGKIGHENDPQWDYVYSRKPTFAYTPYKYWNENAHFKWKDANFAYALTDDSNDSFVPIFDLSDTEFLDKFSALIGEDIKENIDTAQRRFLTDLTQEHLNKYGFNVHDYLLFLKLYWYPYADIQDKELFDKKTLNVGFILPLGSFKFKDPPEIIQRATVPLTPRIFIENTLYALRNH